MKPDATNLIRALMIRRREAKVSDVGGNEVGSTFAIYYIR